MSAILIDYFTAFWKKLGTPGLKNNTFRQDNFIVINIEFSDPKKALDYLQNFRRDVVHDLSGFFCYN